MLKRRCGDQTIRQPERQACCVALSGKYAQAFRNGLRHRQNAILELGAKSFIQPLLELGTARR